MAGVFLPFFCSVRLSVCSNILFHVAFHVSVCSVLWIRSDFLGSGSSLSKSNIKAYLTYLTLTYLNIVDENAGLVFRLSFTVYFLVDQIPKISPGIRIRKKFQILCNPDPQHCLCSV